VGLPVPTGGGDGPRQGQLGLREEKLDSDTIDSPAPAASMSSAPFDAEAGLQAIMDYSSAAIFVKDREGRYSMVNEAFLRPFGLVREEVVGRTAAQVWPDSEVLSEADDMILESGAIDTRDDVVDLPDGPHTIMTVRFPLRDADGGIDGLAAIAQDVSERRAAEEALKERDLLLDTIMTASPDIVTIVDELGRVTAVSHASADTLGYDLSDPVHEEVEQLVHPDDKEAAYGAYARLLTLEDEALDVRYRVRHRDGHWVHLDTRGQAIVGEDGLAKGAVVISRDVSPDLAFEEELQNALAAAQQASAAKSSFLSRMSHELRTPLNSVLGFAQLLEMEDLTPEQAEAVGHILQGGDHLLDLIDEVLDIARIESGHLELSLEPVEIEALICEAVDLTRPSAETNSIRLSLDVSGIPREALVLSDRQRLLQVLLNLLSNAVKYNVSGGNVTVSATSLEDDRSNRLHIAVADDGPGIAPEAIGRAFNPFERLGAERRAVEGTGVGLTLSKHLVEQMGGEITVSSELGVGTTFTVSVPISFVQPPKGAEEGESDDEVGELQRIVGRLRVLHIEDNPANVALVEQVLARIGEVELVSTADGSRALGLAREQNPDLVLLDLHLPDVAGREVLEQLDKDPSTREIPIVVVSADAPALSTEEFSGNVVARLTKPIDVRELLRVVGEVVASVSRRR